MVNISRAQRVFKIPLVLLAFAITLKGINTLKGVIKRQKKIEIRSYESRGKSYLDIKLIHTMLIAYDLLLASIIIEKIRCHFIFENISRSLTKACHEITLATHADGQRFVCYGLFVHVQ